MEWETWEWERSRRAAELGVASKSLPTPTCLAGAGSSLCSVLGVNVQFVPSTTDLEGLKFRVNLWPFAVDFFVSTPGLLR